MTGGRTGTALAVAILCVFLAVKVAYAAVVAPATEIPFVLAVFVIPLLCAVPRTRRLVVRHRWAALAVQALLTWVPFAWFGSVWVEGLGGLLAGLVLLVLPGRAPWLLAGLTLVVDVVVRVAVVGLNPAFPPLGALIWAVVVFVDDGLGFFGPVRLAQIVADVDEARDRAAGVAVARERLEAARLLQVAAGDRLAEVAALITAARRALDTDPAQARTCMGTAGTVARAAVTRVRAVVIDPRGTEVSVPDRRSSAAALGSRLAYATVVVFVCAYAIQGVNNAVPAGYSPGRLAVVVGVLVVFLGLQLHHSWPRSGSRPATWALTLGLQTVALYGIFAVHLGDLSVLAPFLAGSMLLLIRGPWRWAAYAGVVVTWPALFATVRLYGISDADRHNTFLVLYYGAGIAGTGLAVYVLGRLAAEAQYLEHLRDELATAAAMTERLRVARDVHDLLGLGLSALALKADLIDRLVDRDPPRALAELAEMARICAAARADIRLVTGERGRLLLAADLAAAQQILTSAGIDVSLLVDVEPPSVADETLAPVLREAVTNVLRHADARTCTIELVSGDGTLRLRVVNDASTQRAPTRGAAGRGLANLDARVRAAGGRLTAGREGERFVLTAELPWRTGPQMRHPAGA